MEREALDVVVYPWVMVEGAALLSLKQSLKTFAAREKERL